MSCLPKQFDLLSLTEVDKQLENVIMLTANVKKVCKHLERNNMLDCFMLVQPTPGGQNALTAQRLNLKANYDSITEVQVASLVKFYREYGQEYNLENLDWSQTFLKNSCLQALTHKVEERMERRINQQECGGPMFFYIMMEILSTMSAEAKWALIT
eukprot:5741475-Ditylum_brightwellii.AAC.1